MAMPSTRVEPMVKGDADRTGADPLPEDTAAELVRLRALDAALAEAAGSSPVVLFAQDADLRYVWVHNSHLNPRQQRIIGLTDEEVMPPSAALTLTRLKRQVLTGGRPQRQTVRVEMPDGGGTAVYDLTLAPTRDLDGRVIGVTGIAIDTTREERHRQDLEAARAEAKRADRAKSRFLAAASHDLRQPFQAMHLFLHLLEMKLTSDAQRDLARKLGEALESGERLLNTLLEVSALESGTVAASPADVPLGRLLRRLAEEHEPQAAEKGLRLSCVESAATVRTDPVLLDRMLRNLLSNALRHTARGKVLLGARRVPGGMRIEVWDTGPGIPADKQQEIFREFVQLTDGPRDQRQGLGLGLSIVWRTGQLLNHPVGLRSTPGRGSCFSVTVPLATGTAPPPPEPEPAPAEAPPLVAVAEDDRLQLAALEAMLRDWGCQPVAAPSAAGLMALLEQGGTAPDVLVTDMRLPKGEDGPALAARVRARFGAGIPVLLLTGDTHPEVEERARAADLTLVHKPVHPNRLRRALEAATGRSLKRQG